MTKTKEVMMKIGFFLVATVTISVILMVCNMGMFY
jgi:hypothetical protein